MKTKNKILFVCIHNSARSQMAEAYLKEMASESFDTYSAGIEPGSLNQIVVEVMKTDGIDISANKVNSVNEFLDQKIKFDYVVTVCDETSAEKCPYFPGNGKRLHWGFEDPSSINGSIEDRINQTIQIRDQIKRRVKEFLLQYRYIER